jgi:uncharacterized protein YyaL (SSP411 family)
LPAHSASLSLYIKPLRLLLWQLLAWLPLFWPKKSPDVKIFASLLSILSAILTWWKRKELIEQGRKEQILDAVAEVEARVEKAKAAVDVVDSVRDERLRKRFDRSGGGQ